MSIYGIIPLSRAQLAMAILGTSLALLRHKLFHLLGGVLHRQHDGRARDAVGGGV